MRASASDKIFTVDEYIQHELHAERRSEFINGQLYPMPGEKDINNRIAFLLSMILFRFLDKAGYEIFSHDVKLAIPNEDKYFYPDLFVTKEKRAPENQYIKYEPEIIVEVVSQSSHTADYVDKYIDYTKIPSLQYYIIVEPETFLITVYERAGDSNWEAFKYYKPDELVTLGKLGMSFQLKEVYA